MRKKILISLCLVVFMTINGFANSNNKLTLIIMIDNDPRLGVEKDREMIRKLAKDVANKLGMTYKELLLNVSNLTGPELKRKIQSVGIDSQTFSWFHYSGHGLTHDGWPKFKVDRDGHFVTMSGIHNLMSRAGMRLTTVDACNIGSPSTVSPVNARNSEALVTNLARLFKVSQGEARSCSSQTGGLSWSNPSYGGFFTVGLIQAINSVCSSTSKATWDKVLSKTKSITTNLARNRNKQQTPKYHENVRYSQDRIPDGNTPELEDGSPISF
jgi:hypothetical protein